MRVSALHRIAAPIVILTVGALAGTACSDAPQQSTAANVRPVSALNSRVPSQHGKAIQQRVAAKRARHLTGDEVARVKTLRGKWQWAADLHHIAMQEAIRDPSLRGLRQEHTPAERCAIAVRYLTKHYSEIDLRSGKNSSESERVATINNLASQVGVCPPGQHQASIFASATRKIVSLGKTSAVLTATGPVSTDQIATAWHDYAVAMSADIGQARDLADANEIMDTYLATAAADPELPQLSLSLIAGTVDLARSSAQEWDTFARPHEGSMFMWGWLSDLGNWVATVVVGDLGGCIGGLTVEFAAMSAYGFSGSLAEFGGVTEGFCIGGAILGSIGAAI